MADQKSQVRVENTTAHVKHITLQGGEIVTVPPREEGAVTLTFESGEERERFEKALQTGSVRQWIDAKELVVHGGAAPEGEKPQPPHDSSGLGYSGSQLPPSAVQKRGAKE